MDNWQGLDHCDDKRDKEIKVRERPDCLRRVGRHSNPSRLDGRERPWEYETIDLS
jgi:hypothetical protein